MPEDIARDKPINREIDPGELLPGSGALHARPSKPALSSSSSKSTDNEETNNKDLELGQFTTVALHLYAEHLVDEQSNDIWFQMNRKSYLYLNGKYQDDSYDIKVGGYMKMVAMGKWMV